jgi:hypothetical protein
MLMFWMLWTFAMLMQARLELCSLSREAVLGRGRAYSGKAELGKDKERIKRLAKAMTHLDPEQLDLSSEAVGAMDLGDPGAGTGDSLLNNSQTQGFINKLFNWVASCFTGDRLTLSYHYRFKGPLAKLLPQGLTLREDLAGIADCWTLTLKLF